MKKEKIGLLLLLGIVLLSGCSSNDKESMKGEKESPSTQVTTQPEQEATENITWSSDNNEVKLVPIKETAEHEYQGVTVEVNGVKKEFYWEFLEKPRIFYTDVTTDGKKEAVIILNKGKGTGLSIDEVHVLKSEDLSEIKVQSYEEIVTNQIETSVTKKNDNTLAIKVKAQGKEYEFSYEIPNEDFNQDKLNFGGVVYYELENQKLVSRIGASVGISPHYVGDFYIIYKFDSARNELIADIIKFVQ